MPHSMQNKGKVEGHKLEIQGILGALNVLGSNINELSPTLAPIYSLGTATTTVSESGTLLVPPANFVLSTEYSPALSPFSSTSTL
jgi:hypothetical protein